MAYVAQNLSDEDLLKQQQEGAASSAPQLVGDGGSLGEGGVSVQGAPQAGGAPAQQGAPTKSGWTNLRAYLDANRDQAPGLANKVAGNIANQGNEAKGAIDQGLSAFNEQIAKATPTNYLDTINQASANPAQFVKQPQNVETFKNLKAGLFNGPTTFETQPGYGDIASKAERASSFNATAGNKQQMIKDLDPNAGTGQVALNELLLEGEPTAANTIKNAAQPFAGLKDYLANATKTADAAREGAIAKTAEAKQAIQDQFVAPQIQSLKTLQDQINQRTQAASLDFNKDQAIKDLQAYMSGKDTLSPDEALQFIPEGSNISGYDTSALSAKVRDAIIGSLNPVFAGPEYIQKGVDYLVNGSPVEPALMQALAPLAAEMPKYSNNPIERLRAEGVGNDPDWLQKYFGGTNLSSGAPTPAAVATPEEAAKIIALQNLLETGGFINPDELEQAGTYNPARIGKYQPRIGNNGGTGLFQFGFQ